MNISKNSDLFNRLLFESDLRTNSYSGFLVHSSILDNFREFLNKLYHNLVYDYKLQIDQRQYDMKLIHITERSIEVGSFIEISVKYSQFSFPWQKLPNLFRDVDSFYLLLKFIEVFKLQPFIENIEEQVAFASHDHIIKVVMFSKQVDKVKLYEDYRTWISSLQKPTAYYYYITNAFTWLQPSEMDHFFDTFENNLLSNALNTVFDHVTLLNYAGKLNIFDLLSVKFGLCDERNPLHMSNIQCSIDQAIKRLLTGNTIYLDDNVFFLDKYLIAKNISASDSIINYFRYAFQNYFKAVEVNDELVEHLLIPAKSIFRRRLPATIQLIEQYTEIFDIIEGGSNIDFTVDCRFFEYLNLNLFSRLTSFDNVSKIILDTEYRWDRTTCDVQFLNKHKIITIHFVGDNRHNFIEDFLESLGKLSFPSVLLDLLITHSLSNYHMFRDLAVGFVTFQYIDFRNMGNFLNHFNCNFKTIIKFEKCSFDCRSLLPLLANVHSNKLEIDVLEDNYTFQYIYEYALSVLINSNILDLKIDRLQISFGDNQKIYLNELAFTLNEARDKVELKDRRTNKIVDLFYLKNNITPEDEDEVTY